MKNISIGDGGESIYLFSGMELTESDIDQIDRIKSRLHDRIVKLERGASALEDTRLNLLEHSHDTLWKSVVKTNKILEETKKKVSGEVGRQTLNQIAHARLYKEIDKNHNLIEHLAGVLARDSKAARERDKRLSDIEEFLGDL
jgi:glycyl-tRNA synthetase beta subunit